MIDLKTVQTIDLPHLIWEACIQLLKRVEEHSQDFPPEERALEFLRTAHSAVDNAACQLSVEISKIEHPGHFREESPE